MRDASGPSPSLYGWLAAPPLQACPSPSTSTRVATVRPRRLKSVTLMRGPGLAGVRDGRPYHAVHGPTRGVRWSLALRMRAGAPGA